MLLTLLGFSDLLPSTEVLAFILQLPLTSIQNALSSLTELGVIDVSEDSTYRFAHQNFRIPNAPNSEQLRRFHEYCIERARLAVDLPVDLRKFRSLKFALSPEEFCEALEVINEFSISLLSRYPSTTLKGRRLYMLESLFFPVSRLFLGQVDLNQELTNQSLDKSATL